MSEQSPQKAQTLLPELINIGKSYNYKLIFKNVNLSLESGSVNLLIGANGSGKSTLLKIIAGLVKYDQGKIKYCQETNNIAYLAHNAALYPNLSALENLRFWSKYQNLKHSVQDLQEILNKVNLQKFSNELCGTFSRGMLQRLNLARILLQDAQLILLDEPATGLDQSSKEILEQEILTAKNRQACVLWISHDYEKDQKLADHVYLLENKTLLKV